MSFNADKGKTLGVIGSNGAGKSTLLKTLAGIFAPDSGSIKLHTESVSLLSLGAGFEHNLNGIQNIYLNGILLGLKRKVVSQRLDSIIEFADIGDFIDKPIRTYSSGMRSRLAFAISISVEPDILLLDEMLGVGDQEFREKSAMRIRELINSDRTVVLVAHNMTTIRELCDNVIWLHGGILKEQGTSKSVVRKYLDHVAKKRRMRRLDNPQQ